MRKLKTTICILLMLTLLACVATVFVGCQKDDLAPKEKVVYYSDFGAKGDGKTDDFVAICDAHSYANKHGCAVAADKGATYYIGGKMDEDKTHTKSAVIKTNTYWQDAHFIIDDFDITEKAISAAQIFSVESDVAPQIVELPNGYSLSAKSKKTKLQFDDKKLLHIVNSHQEDFIRSGEANGSYGKGAARQEVILVNKWGMIDHTTPLTWDYDQVTSITAYSVTDKPVTVSGGFFTTIANNSMDVTDFGSYYFYRGILVTRSNTTLKNISHNMVYTGGKEVKRCPYAGFYAVEKANNILIQDCIAFGHWTNSSYEFHNLLAINVTWKNVVQYNGFEGNGIHGSNYCRNLVMDGCKLNRFDAHKGVYNATIKNCELKGISVTGFGKLLVENVVKNQVKDEDYGEQNFLSLRSDYGAFWRGDIVIKNCTLKTNAAVNYLISIYWKYDWYYGYECQMPTNVLVDNVTVEYHGLRKSPYPYFYVFTNIDGTRTLTLESMAKLKHPLTLTKTVTVQNCTTTYKLTHNQTGLLDNTKFVQK